MFQVAVRADSPIKSFEDMKGANISPGKAKWTGTAFAESILKAYGMSFQDIQVERWHGPPCELHGICCSHEGQAH